MATYLNHEILNNKPNNNTTKKIIESYKQMLILYLNSIAGFVKNEINIAIKNDIKYRNAKLIALETKLYVCAIGFASIRVLSIIVDSLALAVKLLS